MYTCTVSQVWKLVLVQSAKVNPLQVDVFLTHKCINRAPGNENMAPTINTHDTIVANGKLLRAGIHKRILSRKHERLLPQLPHRYRIAGIFREYKMLAVFTNYKHVSRIFITTNLISHACCIKAAIPRKLILRKLF